MILDIHIKAYSILLKDLVNVVLSNHYTKDTKREAGDAIKDVLDFLIEVDAPYLDIFKDKIDNSNMIGYEPYYVAMFIHKLYNSYAHKQVRGNKPSHRVRITTKMMRKKHSKIKRCK